MGIEEEKTAAMRYIRAALAKGYAVNVWEGGDYAIERSTSARAIRAALASTDIDHVEIIKPSACAEDKWANAGTLMFVWGNSPEEVLSDYTDAPAIQAIVEEVDA